LTTPRIDDRRQDPKKKRSFTVNYRVPVLSFLIGTHQLSSLPERLLQRFHFVESLLSEARNKEKTSSLILRFLLQQYIYTFYYYIIIMTQQCEVVLVGCGAPGRGMGWYHAEQLLKNKCPSAVLKYIVEPWFLGAGTFSVL
jgi:hypothetical protein